MEENYYGILMQKIEIYENIVIYIPKRIISGELSKAIGDDKSPKVFVEKGYGKDYILMNDINSILPPNDEVVGFVISEEELLKQADEIGLENAKIEYFDKNSETAKIGFYIPEQFEDKLIFLDLDLESLKAELSDAKCDKEGNVNISYYDVVSSLINLDSFNEIVKLDETKFVNEESEEKIKLSKNKINSDIVTPNDITREIILEEHSEVKKQEQEETFDSLLNKLKLLSPKALLKYNDVNIMKQKASSVRDICNRMKKEIEKQSIDGNVKKAILKSIDSTECYYDSKIYSLQDIDCIKAIIVNFGFAYENNFAVLEYYSGILKSETQKEIVKDEKRKSKKPFSIKKVKEICDRTVIGQEEAKETVISAVYMNKLNGNPLNKNTVLLVGPTGSGKTLIAETVAKSIDIPSVSIDTTQLTISGYKGADIENYLATLITRAGGDVEKAKQGIVILDEFDKKGSENNSDVSGKGVLNSLLPFIQGTLYKVNMGKGYTERTIDFDTHNLTVLVAGSCTDAIKAVLKEKNKRIGFQTSSNEENINSNYCELTKEDIEKYCNIPEEFMGRITNMVQLKPHTKESVKQILLESDISPLLSEKEKLELDDIELFWNDGYIERLTEKTLENTHGVRELKNLIETSIMPARWKALHEEDLFNKIILNEKSVDDPYETVLVYNDGNFTTVRQLNEKQDLEKSKIKGKVNDKK